MPDFPPVTILINTFRRYDEIQHTLDSLITNIIYPADKLRWLIADDCSGNGYPQNLLDIERYQALNLKITTLSRNSGYGASINNGLSHVDTPYVYYSEDDWVLCQKLDMRAGIGLLETCPHIGMLRYGGTSGDMLYDYHQFEANVSDYVKENIYAADYVEGKVTCLQIDIDSPSLYVYSGRPQLAKLRWYYDLGLFPEGLRVGETENAMCHKVKDFLRASPNTHEIAILPDFVNMKYRHIGAMSYQNKAVEA